MKHTPEPWNVYDSKPKQVRICRVGEERIDQGALATFAASADAWRSILCVNALAGKNPEGVADLVEAARAMVREYRRGEDVISAVRALSAALDKLEES